MTPMTPNVPRRPTGRRTWRSAMALAIAVGSAAVAAAVPSTRPTTAPSAWVNHTPFVTVLLRDWSAWDRNGDGVLSTDEIDRAVRDPNVRGADAAAAAALKLLAENKQATTPLPPLTRAYFAQYDRAALELHRRSPAVAAAATRPAAAEAATVDTVSGAAATQPAARSARLPTDWDLYYLASRQRIVRGGSDPWPGRFVLDHTRQGPLGDCYFVSAVGDVIAHDPSRIAKLVTPVGDGHFRVTFPGLAPVVVGPLTDAELAISSTTAGDGVWLALLEQALGRTRGRQRAGTEDVEGVDEIRDGGSTGASITLLTGHPVSRYRFARTLEARQAASAKLLPHLRRSLIDALADGRMVLATVHPPVMPTTREAATRPALAVGTVPKFPPNITLKHAYAVLAYDPKTDVVTFWNPHGQTFHPTGPAGLANGYPTEHGRFNVPMGELQMFVTSFTIERPASPTTAPSAADARR
jgi:hypothetical protein